MKALAPRRVVLARPRWGSLTTRTENTYNRTWPPLSSLYIAAALRQAGASVDLVDLQASSIAPKQALCGVTADDLVFIATAEVDRWQCPNIEMRPIDELAGAAAATGATTFLTGTHASVAPLLVVERTGATGAIVGEPEEAATALALGKPPGEIRGVFTRDGIDNGPAPSVDMTALPRPDYSMVDLDQYGYELLGPRFALLEGSRGCPFPCTFCSRVIEGRTVRRKRPEQLIGEVDEVIDRFGAKTAYLIDLEFHLGGATSIALCDHLAARGRPLRWCAQLRPREVTDELVRALERGGCRLVHCGIETGSAERLAELDKVGRLEEMVSGVEKLLAAGIEVLCFFILGFPGESEPEIEQTIQLALSLSPSYASFHLFTPYPGTSYALAPTGGPQFVPPTHPDALPLERLSRLRRGAYLRFYLRPGYVMSRIKRRDYGFLLRQARLFLSQIAA